jgi:site-specific DNA-methyltransferase (adenine-specific)
MANAPRNRTIVVDPKDSTRYKRKLLHITSPVTKKDISGRTICQDISSVIPLLPARFVDLLIIDPPYNLTKSFRGNIFQERDKATYQKWFESWFIPLLKILKPNASVYVCAEWRFSSIVEQIVSEHLTIRNRITWEREKGRGANANWKNCSEDIWFATASNDYYFNVDAAKLKRRVLAPYRDSARKPKDWQQANGANFRLTHPSNLWTDITVPFWSMPENTDHPTQKPEKLLAKIILASSRKGDFVLDPFAGSGTTQVVAKKLGRAFCGVEIDKHYCVLTEKRLQLAETDTTIQGFEDGVFYERNSGK